ncbi:hypothetical protein KVV02_007241 [Mortierella alpina]|uniref:Uncharacterized protein n=1 Tax=Mortierella alpina TaxID=64518 RepID=A0A9P8A231_MORAP|nr:hypothetical protein KVV02_007241 [Mortierella alpina]
MCLCAESGDKAERGACVRACDYSMPQREKRTREIDMVALALLVASRVGCLLFILFICAQDLFSLSAPYRSFAPSRPSLTHCAALLISPHSLQLGHAHNSPGRPAQQRDRQPGHPSPYAQLIPKAN